MGYSRRWRIDSLDKLRTICTALLDSTIDFRAHPMELVYRDEFKEKSDGQRALFHAICDDIAWQIGYTPGELKDALKRQYFGDGWERMSTEDLDHEHYGYLIELAYYIGAWCGVVVPDRRRR